MGPWVEAEETAAADAASLAAASSSTAAWEAAAAADAAAAAAVATDTGVYNRGYAARATTSVPGASPRRMSAGGEGRNGLLSSSDRFQLEAEAGAYTRPLLSST
jgi:hypothetical protein